MLILELREIPQNLNDKFVNIFLKKSAISNVAYHDIPHSIKFFISKFLQTLFAWM